MIVVFSGPPCSGKSVLGALLAERRKITHLEMDAIRVRLIPGSAHSRRERMIAYRAMHLAAELLLERGQSVILNACYGHAEDRREVERIAVSTRSPLFLIECQVPAEVAVERSRQRWGSHPGVDLTEERVNHLVQSFPFCGKGLVIDSTSDVDHCLEQIDNYLSSGRPLAVGRWTAAAEIHEERD